MSHEHAHDHCEHARLKFCKTCNVVHCLACKVEWGKPVTIWRWAYWPTGTYSLPTSITPTTTPEITWNGSVSGVTADTVTVNSCQHGEN